jgi:hypothetical protein
MLLPILLTVLAAPELAKAGTLPAVCVFAAGAQGSQPATLLGAWPALLAAEFPSPPPGTIEPWMLAALFFIAGAVMILKLAELCVRLFGRKPALHVELEAVDKRHRELEDQLDERATKEELRRLEQAWEKRFEKMMSAQAFEDYRTERKADFARLEKSIGELVTKVDEYSTTSYNGRRRLHAQAQGHERAIAFMAGKIEGAGERVMQLMQTRPEGEA